MKFYGSVANNKETVQIENCYFSGSTYSDIHFEDGCYAQPHTVNIYLISNQYSVLDNDLSCSYYTYNFYYDGDLYDLSQVDSLAIPFGSTKYTTGYSITPDGKWLIITYDGVDYALVLSADTTRIVNP
jgi:hypothetical protein